MKIFGDNVLSLYICTQTIKGFYVYLLSSFYIGVRSFVKSTGSSFFSHPPCAYFRKILLICDKLLSTILSNIQKITCII